MIWTNLNVLCHSLGNRQGQNRESSASKGAGEHTDHQVGGLASCAPNRCANGDLFLLISAVAAFAIAF